MNSEPELVKIRDEVFRKIGRNLLNFQKIELMLKHFIKYSRISGPISKLQENKERQAAAVHKQMLGNLVGQFMENTFSGLGNTNESTTELKEPHFSFSFTVEADEDFYQSKKQALKSLVEDRNNLIHHLMPRFNPESIDSCLEIEKYLDEQRERLIPEYDYLKSIIESRQSFADFFNSEEGRTLLNSELQLSFLQQSPVIQLLLNVSIQHARSDGWTLMSEAGNQIRKILPDELVQLKSGWGYKTLKELMEASGFFDFNPEPTEKGGVRLLYRSKPELAFVSIARIMNSLQDSFNQTASSEGWALLSTAHQQIEELLAEDFALVKEKHGLSSLKAMILETGIFELVEESTDSGETYVLYRPKTE